MMIIQTMAQITRINITDPIPMPIFAPVDRPPLFLEGVLVAVGDAVPEVVVPLEVGVEDVLLPLFEVPDEVFVVLPDEVFDVLVGEDVVVADPVPVPVPEFVGVFVGELIVFDDDAGATKSLGSSCPQFACSKSLQAACAVSLPTPAVIQLVT